jgi:hypothetical protein
MENNLESPSEKLAMQQLHTSSLIPHKSVIKRVREINMLFVTREGHRMTIADERGCIIVILYIFQICIFTHFSGLYVRAWQDRRVLQVLQKGL